MSHYVRSLSDKQTSLRVFDYFCRVKEMPLAEYTHTSRTHAGDALICDATFCHSASSRSSRFCPAALFLQATRRALYNQHAVTLPLFTVNLSASLHNAR